MRLQFAYTFFRHVYDPQLNRVLKLDSPIKSTIRHHLDVAQSCNAKLINLWCWRRLYTDPMGISHLKWVAHEARRRGMGVIGKIGWADNVREFATAANQLRLDGYMLGNEPRLEGSGTNDQLIEGVAERVKIGRQLIDHGIIMTAAISNVYGQVEFANQCWERCDGSADYLTLNPYPLWKWMPTSENYSDQYDNIDAPIWTSEVGFHRASVPQRDEWLPLLIELTKRFTDVFSYFILDEFEAGDNWGLVRWNGGVDEGQLRVLQSMFSPDEGSYGGFSA